MSEANKQNNNDEATPEPSTDDWLDEVFDGDSKQLRCKCGCNTLVSTKLVQKNSFRRGSIHYHCPACGGFDNRIKKNSTSGDDYNPEYDCVDWESIKPRDQMDIHEYVKPADYEEALATIARQRKELDQYRDAAIKRYQAMLD